jgi:serine/threonine protein phosphatase PrpC
MNYYSSVKPSPKDLYSKKHKENKENSSRFSLNPLNSEKYGIVKSTQIQKLDEKSGINNFQLENKNRRSSSLSSKDPRKNINFQSSKGFKLENMKNDYKTNNAKIDLVEYYNNNKNEDKFRSTTADGRILKRNNDISKPFDIYKLKEFKVSPPIQKLIKPLYSTNNNKQHQTSKMENIIKIYKTSPTKTPNKMPLKAHYPNYHQNYHQNYDSFDSKVIQLHKNLKSPRIQIINTGNTSSPGNISTDCSPKMFNPSGKSVKEFAYKENQNSEYRETMEDFCKITDKFMNDNSKGLFCLYDGHGGTELVKYVRDRMPILLSKNLENYSSPEKALTQTFTKIDDEVKLLSENQNVGCTACVVYFLWESQETSKRVFYCANVGDTRAVLLTATDVKRISYDHKCTDPEEVQRVRSLGGIVFNGRMFGQLALSRALGDHAMKKYGLCPRPAIHKHFINEKDKYIVVCSDGVWDVIEESEILKIAQNSENADQLSENIVNKAVKNGSRDNISCLVIKIN